MKKYKEFIENSEEEYEHEKKYVLVLTISDLAGDYYFYDNYGKFFHNGKLPYNEPESWSISIKNEICDYIGKLFNENDLRCEKFWFGQLTQHIGISTSDEFLAYFYGNKSDLEKINNYYGLENAIRPPSSFESKHLKWNILDKKL
jgi:hypothetical protein